jgi:hypothetical protein
MRPTTMVVSSLLFAAPLVSLWSTAHADNGSNLAGHAQRFLNNRDESRDYERGRDEDRTLNNARDRDHETRRQQAERNGYRRDEDRAWSSDDRDRPSYGNNANYR